MDTSEDSCVLTSQTFDQPFFNYIARTGVMGTVYAMLVNVIVMGNSLVRNVRVSACKVITTIRRMGAA